jgi:NAD(P)-dependent dehydrogenase (short-subunit alcohol dehydrogenase family)
MSQVALITGCSSGVGLALAVRMGSAGFHVYASMRNTSKDAELQAAIKAAGIVDRVFVTELDVVSTESVNNAVAKIIEKEGKIDVLVNNAGFSKFGGVEMMPIEDMKDQFETNFFGCCRTMQAVLPHMRKQKSGRIINVSSVGGIWGQPLNDVYCASKFALEGFTEGMASVYGQFGIHCSLIEPGGIKSAFLHNAQKPDVANLPADIVPFVARIGKVYADNAASSNAQTSDEVAQVIVDCVNNPKPPLRVQTNPLIQKIFEAQLKDTTGNTGVAIATSRFFPEGWRQTIGQ